jgi:hypothetical protein
VNPDLVILAVYGVLFAVGLPLAVRRLRRDRLRQGQLSLHDGDTLVAPKALPPARLGMVVERTMIGPTNQWRLGVAGLEIARELGFRLEGLTTRTSTRVEGRLVVEGTKGSKKAERLFARADVNAAVAVVCGASASFSRIDLFPEGDLAIVVEGGSDAELADLGERMMRFAVVLEGAVPWLEQDDVDLGSTSGTTSAAFSIEIRS